MKNVKMIDAHYERDQKYEVGEKVMFRTGKATKEQISLTPIEENDKSGLCLVNFKVDKDFVVDDEPYYYYCVVNAVNEKGKITSVRLARRVKKLPGNIGEHRDYPDTDTPFNVFSPQVFAWHDPQNMSGRDDGLIFYETYVIHSFNAPFTPVLGTACRWEYLDEDMEPPKEPKWLTV